MNSADLPILDDASILKLNLEDLRGLAKDRLPHDIFDYVDGGAGHEATMLANRQDFDAVTLAPLVMRDVSKPQTAVSLLGRTWSTPIALSPTALHQLVHPEGELATARGARTAGVPLIVSAMSSIALETIAEQSGHDQLWLQTYLFKDRGLTTALIARALAAGFVGVVVTAGCPVVGYRDRNSANRFVLPSHIKVANFDRVSTTSHNNPIHGFAGAEIDPAACWDDVASLCAATPLPVLIKGVVNPDDVEAAVDCGAAGLIVSNHGGRQLDTTASSISVLPSIAAKLDRRGVLLVDSGVRRGTDVLKILALGADGALIGRPALWALAVGGAEGLAAAIKQLDSELRVAMQLVGCADVSDLRRAAHSIVRWPAEWRRDHPAAWNGPSRP